MLRHVQCRHLQQVKQQNHQPFTMVMPTNHCQQHQLCLINGGLWMMCYNGLSQEDRGPDSDVGDPPPEQPEDDGLGI